MHNRGFLLHIIGTSPNVTLKNFTTKNVQLEKNLTNHGNGPWRISIYFSLHDKIKCADPRTDDF